MRKGGSLGSLRNIGKLEKRPTGLKGPKGILADDSEDSSDYAFATHSDDFADSSDSAFAAHSDDIADCSDFAFAAPPSTLPIVATLPLLLKNICSKRWSHCPETIVSKGTGTLSVAVGEA